MLSSFCFVGIFRLPPRAAPWPITIRSTNDPKAADKFLDAELDKVSAAHSEGKKYTIPKSGKFAVFAERFVRLWLSTKKYSTQKTEGSRVKRLVRDLGNYQVKDLGPELIQEFLTSINHPKTARNYRATLGMMWNSAKAWGYTSCDWFEGIALPEVVQAEQPFFTLEEMRRIIARAFGAHRTFYWLAAETGMRLGELCALHVKEINFSKGVLIVRYSAWQGHLGTTKRKKPREFRLSTRLLRRLADEIAPVSNDSEAFVFRTSKGTPWIGDDLVKRHLKPLLKQLGIKQGIEGVGCHAFRHGNSTAMDSSAVNAPLKVRQDRMGHSDEEMTFLYTHAEGAEHQAVAERLGELLVPNATLAEMEPASPKAT